MIFKKFNFAFLICISIYLTSILNTSLNWSITMHQMLNMIYYLNNFMNMKYMLIYKIVSKHNSVIKEQLHSKV